MKNLLKFIAFALIAIPVFNSCEDNYTEEDAMEAQQVVDLIISVTDESNFNQPVEAATVSTVINGTTVEKATDETGSVTFEEVKIGGNLNVYVSKENYTKTFTTVNTTPSNYRQSTISATISIYSLADANTATVKGQLTIETDLTNRSREVLEGMEVKAFNFDLPNGGNKAFIGTTDSEGKYEIKVPVNSDGDDNIRVKFNQLDTIRTAGAVKNNVYSVKNQKAYYAPEYYERTQIPPVPSAVISIEAPGAAGTGFELITEMDTTWSYLTMAASNMNITKTGSGYFPDISGTDTTLWVPFSPDTKGLDTAHVQLTFEKNGGLISIDDLRDNGTGTGRNAKYSEKPTIDLDLGSGSGAEIYFNFKLYYNIWISNNGTGYKTFPTVKKTFNSIGTELVTDYPLSSFAFIADGSIYSDGGGRLSMEGQYYSAPTFEIINPTGKQAIAYLPTWGIDGDSTIIDDESWVSQGDNYDPANPPAVTITALSGYGSNAKFTAEVSVGSGVINDLELINEGSGYVRNINDYLSNGTTNHQNGDYGSINEYNFYDVLPGDILISNAYYGTGQVIELE